MIHHALGHPRESETTLQTLIDDFGWTAAFQIAQAYAARNDSENAFEWLERAYVQRDPGVTYLATDLFLRTLHGDPRWQPFLRKIHLA